MLVESNIVLLFQEAKLCVKEKFELNTMKYFVQFSLEWVLDRDSKKRKMVGQLYHDLIMEKLLTSEHLLEGYVDHALSSFLQMLVFCSSYLYHNFSLYFV